MNKFISNWCILFAIRFPWWIYSWGLPAVSSRSLLPPERHSRAKWPVCRRLLLSWGTKLWKTTATCLLSGTLLWEGQPCSTSLQAIVSHHCWTLHVMPSSLAVSFILSWQMHCCMPWVNCFPPVCLTVCPVLSFLVFTVVATMIMPNDACCSPDIKSNKITNGCFRAVSDRQPASQAATSSDKAKAAVRHVLLVSIVNIKVKLMCWQIIEWQSI